MSTTATPLILVPHEFRGASLLPTLQSFTRQPGHGDGMYASLPLSSSSLGCGPTTCVAQPKAYESRTFLLAPIFALGCSQFICSQNWGVAVFLEVLG